MVATHDPIVKERIEKGPKNATYLSLEIQNFILKIMGQMARDIVCDEVRQSGLFSLMADETKDASKQEQLTVVLRYVDQKGIINEHFLTFVQATHLNAESLTSYL